MPKIRSKSAPKPLDRPVFQHPSEQMRAWAAALAYELSAWPGVTLKRAFGMTMVYRGATVFAALPGTRSLHTSDAILLKFAHESAALKKKIDSDPRIQKTELERTNSPKHGSGEGRKWRVFAMRLDSDLHSALEWLLEAFEAVRATR